jgi:antitoxin CcdA
MGIEARKPANLSISPGLLAEAKTLGLNISRAAEDGLRAAVIQAKSEAWKRENAAAIEFSNEWVRNNGLPLEKYRLF